MSIRACVHHLLTVLALLGLLLSPVQPLVGAGLAPARADAVGRVANSSYSATETGLFRTRVTVRNPADWVRLERLGVVVLEEITAEERAADEQPVPARVKSADQGFSQSASFRKSVAILADEDQLEALARLRFEPQRAGTCLPRLGPARPGRRWWSQSATLLRA